MRPAPVPLSTAMPSVRSQACGKVILLGEHAVVYGAPAIAAPACSMNLSLTFQRHTQETQLWLEGQKLPSNTANIINKTYTLLKHPQESGVIVRGQSEIPFGAGLGSSAALSVALVKGVAEFEGLPLDGVDIPSLANELEKTFHGKPSGLDTAAVAANRPILFRDGVVQQVLSLRKTWRLALIDSGERSSTEKMVRLAAPCFVGAAGSRMLDQFSRLTAAAVLTLAQGSEDEMSEVLGFSAQLLEDIGVVTPNMKALAALAIESGALAAKTTGAGGGGCVLALLPSEKAHSTRVMMQLKRALPRNPIYELSL